MKTKPLTFLLALTFLFSLTSTSVFADHDFYYEKVIACGPKVVERIPNDISSLGYYVIHENMEGSHYSIYNNGIEFPSFKTIHYTNLYVQSGGVRWLEFKKSSDSIIKFELHTKQISRGWKVILTLDTVASTAIRKLIYDDPPEGFRSDARLLVCWDYKK